MMVALHFYLCIKTFLITLGLGAFGWLVCMVPYGNVVQYCTPISLPYVLIVCARMTTTSCLVFEKVCLTLVEPSQ
jgi:hypothetical protein